MVDVGNIHEMNDGESPSAAIVRAVASMEGADETDIDVLAETIDPDALDRIVSEDGARVEFEYQEYTVVVSKGKVQLVE